MDSNSAGRKRVLVVTDGISAGWVRQADAPDTCWSSLVLGHNPDLYLRQNQDSLAHLDHRVLRVEEHARSAERDLQSFYPEFIFSFPREVHLRGLTLLELLRRKDGVNLWWFGETCEKAPLRGPFLERLFRLALLRRVLDSNHFDEVWLYMQDADSRACIASGLESAGQPVRCIPVPAKRGIKQWLREDPRLSLPRLLAVRFIIITNLILTRWLLFLSGVRPLGNGSDRPLVGFYSRYPILWQNPYSKEQEERYFSYLAKGLEERARVCYLVWFSDWFWQLAKHRKGIRALFADGNIVPLALYVNFGNILRALFDVGLPLRYLRYTWRMAPVLRAEFLGWDISRLWDTELRRTIAGGEIQQNQLIMSTLRNITARVQLRLLFNPLEFQPMERAIWLGARPHTTTLAVQHSTFCANHLMYFFKNGELKEYADGTMADPSPVPDYYAVSGTWPHQIMLENGVAPERLTICGAIRYNNLLGEDMGLKERNLSRQRLGMPLDLTVVLVLTSISREESSDLVDTLAQAVPQLKGRLVFTFRCHYHCRIEDHIERTFSKMGKNLEWRILDVNGPLYDYIRAADVVLAGGSTVAVEALALGRFPIIYRSPTLLNLSPLLDSGEAAIFVSSPEELACSLIEVASGSTYRGSFSASRAETIERLFYKLDGTADQRLVSYVESQGLLAD